MAILQLKLENNDQVRLNVSVSKQLKKEIKIKCAQFDVSQEKLVQLGMSHYIDYLNRLEGQTL